MTTLVGLLRGGRGGVWSPGGIAVVTLAAVGAFFTVATLALDPIESLLDAMLNFDGDEAPLCVVL